MNISTLNYLNFNTTYPTFKQRVNNSSNDENIKDQFELNYKTKRYIENLSNVYKNIYQILDSKTRIGVNKLVRESGQFNSIDGLTFKNINKNNEAISFEILPSNIGSYVKILSKDERGEILKGYLLNEKKVAIKNYDISNPDRIPQVKEYYTKEEGDKLNIENDISNMLETIDFSMLQTRRFVESRKDGDLKPLPAIMPEAMQFKINNLNKLSDETDEVCASIPPSTLTKNKLAFFDYVIQQGHGAYKFKNIGDENLTIFLSKLDNPTNGKMTRLMVYNPDNTVRTGYVFKDNKILSNFNPQHLSIFPNKLNFVNVDEINSEHYNEELNSYLDGYTSKFTEFKDYLIKRRDTDINALSEEDAAIMSDISDLYKDIETLLGSMSYTNANKAKNNYVDYSFKTKKNGFTFKNVGPNRKLVNIFKNKSEDTINITTLNSRGEKDLELTIKNNTSFVNNYKISDDLMNEKLKLLTYLPALKTKLTEFRDATQDYKSDILTTRASRRKRTLDINSNDFANNQEYKDFEKASLKEIKSVLSNMKNADISVFDDAISKIRARLIEFLEVSNNNS